MSLTQLREVPIGKTILFVGPPGAGKSTFCQQTVLQNLAANKSIIFVTTEYSSQEAETYLKQKGLPKNSLGLLNYIDGYTQTVGLPIQNHPDIINVNCGNLTSLGIALVKHQRKIGKKGVLLVFDSLTSPYLLSGSEIVRFFRLTLSRFAGDGNSVLVCFDEGSGKEEDVVGMMSISNGVVKMSIKEKQKIFEVIKHPRIKPRKTKIPLIASPTKATSKYDLEYFKHNVRLYAGLPRTVLRKETGDYVNIAWRNLMFWSGMLWDPKRFPTIMYDWIKYSYNLKNSNIDFLSFFPWQKRLVYKLFMPKSLNSVKDMKRWIEGYSENFESDFKISKMEYLEDISKTSEHHYRIHENYECWGFENVGAPLALVRPAMTIASLNGFDKDGRDWNIVETKCLGLGDSCCEYKLVPGEIEELNVSLEKDSCVIEKINDRIIGQILGFLCNGKPLMERPNLGGLIHIHDVQRITSAPESIENLQLIFRMGGAKAGKMLGERLIESGVKEQEVINHIVKLIEHCKVGIVSVKETVRIRENCEKFGIKTKNPSCHFTTGFLNGFFYAIKNQHLIETKCLASGDPYCEWEFV